VPMAGRSSQTSLELPDLADEPEELDGERSGLL